MGLICQGGRQSRAFTGDDESRGFRGMMLAQKQPLVFFAHAAIIQPRTPP